MAPEPAARPTLRAELRALILEYGSEVDLDFADDTPLISSGVVESTTLLHVALWVEERVGAEVDISSFDLASEWDSVAAILDFVARHAPAGSRSGPRPA